MKLEINGWAIESVHGKPDTLRISSDQCYGSLTLTAGGDCAFKVEAHNSKEELVSCLEVEHEEVDVEPNTERLT